MAQEKVILAGFDVENNKKWYCNIVDGEKVKCCDTFDENGRRVQRIAHYIITGEEEWKYNPISKCYYFLADNKYYDEVDGGRIDPMMCTHFRWTSDCESTPLYMFSGGKKNEIQFNYDNGVDGVENFVNWLKNQLKKREPVRVQYVLMYPYYYETGVHKRTTIQIMNGLKESIRSFEKRNK